MQSFTLTRKELYELIWSKPMTKVAQDFGVSDVWISKICKEADIPRPPVGYWQKLDAGKKPTKKALPPPKLLAGDIIYIKSKTSHSVGGSKRLSDEEIVNSPEPNSPEFAESIDAFKQRIEGRVGKLVLPEKLSNVHPMIAKLIKEDERRIEENRHRDWSWGRKPLYQSPEGKKLLIALNCLYWTWNQLGAHPWVSNGRDLRCAVEFSGSYLSVTFQVIPEGVKSAKLKSGEQPVYEFAWDFEYQYHDFRKHSSYRTFKSITGETLRSLIIESIVLTEKRMRGSAQWRYERELDEREQAAARIEQRRLAEIKRKENEVEQLKASRLEKIDEALGLFDRAEKIRALIAAFDEKYAARSADMPHYDHWRSWAMHYSNSLDPRHWSPSHVERWVAGFKLKE